MSDLKHENEAPVQQVHPHGLKLVIPFLAVLALLTVVSFIIPLRPTVSESEKRELTKFPAFSAETLLSGEYFDEITLWFSDTFPGRESWLNVASYTESLHGYSEISVVEGNFVDELLNPVAQETTENTETQEATPTPEPTPEGWGGIDAGEDAEIHMGGIIQIGDSAFNRLGYSVDCSKKYTKSLSNLGDLLAEQGVRLISAPAPTAIGILVEEQYLKKLDSADQNATLAAMHDPMSENVITVDTVSALLEHNDEYLFFRTDHHWTALGAYYAYEAVCEALGMEARPLDDFEAWDKGRFIGSHYGKVMYPLKLEADYLTAYIPPQEIQAYIHYDHGWEEGELLRDIPDEKIHSKYLTFLGSDYKLMKLVNEEITDDSTCLIVKDSYGNCFAPFVTQNYHTVYVMDYRKNTMPLTQFCEKYEVDDVWFSPYLIATQSHDGNDMFARLCR